MPTYLATIRYSLELRDGSLIETSDNNTFVNPHIISCDPEDRYDFSSQTENPVHRYGGHHHRARLFPNTEDSHRCAGIPRSQCTMYADCGNIHVKFCLLWGMESRRWRQRDHPSPRFGWGPIYWLSLHIKSRLVMFGFAPSTHLSIRSLMGSGQVPLCHWDYTPRSNECETHGNYFVSTTNLKLWEGVEFWFADVTR